MDKQLFIDSVEAIMKQREIDKKCNEAFKVILPNDFVTFYNNDILFSHIIFFLKKEMNDNNKDSWIEYFIYETECGKKYYDGMCKFNDGSIIDISTPEKLYDFLINEMKLKK